MTYIATGGFILRDYHYSDIVMAERIICTVPEAAAAYVHLKTGPAICEEQGHDWSVGVPGVRDMYVCFRCEEPGWRVPLGE